MSMIANPKKNVVVAFTLAETKSVIGKIPHYFKQKYTLDKQNDILNQTTFGALEFLSLGVFIDINLNSISENKTDIIIEVRRKIGAFDTWVEVSKANTHLADLFDGISVLLTNIKKNTVSIQAANPVEEIKINLPIKDIKRQIETFLKTYPTGYKSGQISSTNEIAVLRRMPLKNDDFFLDIEAIIKITEISSNENSSHLKLEITNDNNSISTQGELNRNTQILKITIKLLTKIINDLELAIAKAELELENIQKWKFGRNKSAKELQLDTQALIIESLKTQLRQPD